MNEELKILLDSPPFEIKYDEIVDFEGLDERISSVGVLFANTIGVSENIIEFCPDNAPPSMEEKISWIWVFRPDLANEVLSFNLSTDLRILIESYRDSQMERFWDHVT